MPTHFCRGSAHFPDVLVRNAGHGIYMKENVIDAKERIMNTVVGLLLEGKDVNAITNRQIAEMADTNSALINYYYQSKENLLSKAVALCMDRMTGKLFEKTDQLTPPVHRLRNMIKAISAFSVDNYELSLLAIGSELKSGSLNTVNVILPILREIFGESKNETILKLMAMQIVIPLQVMFLNSSDYKGYLYADISDETTRNKLIDMIIDNVLQESLF